jgi:hypothetical protein
MTEQGLTPGQLSSARMRRAKVFDGGAWSAAVTAVSAGVVAFLAWLAYVLAVDGTSQSAGSSTLVLLALAVAISATVFCAAFSAAYLVLRTFERHAAIDDER